MPAGAAYLVAISSCPCFPGPLEARECAVPQRRSSRGLCSGLAFEHRVDCGVFPGCRQLEPLRALEPSQRCPYRQFDGCFRSAVARMPSAARSARFPPGCRRLRSPSPVCSSVPGRRARTTSTAGAGARRCLGYPGAGAPSGSRLRQHGRRLCRALCPGRLLAVRQTLFARLLSGRRTVVVPCRTGCSSGPPLVRSRRSVRLGTWLPTRSAAAWRTVRLRQAVVVRRRPAGSPPLPRLRTLSACACVVDSARSVDGAASRLQPIGRCPAASFRGGSVFVDLAV